MQVTTGETDLPAHRSRFVLHKKRSRWSQLRRRWFPASLLMEMQYGFRFLPNREHSETETCPESTSEGTLCIFKLTVEKYLIYCGRGSKHNPCCTNSKAILVTIVKIAIIIATTIAFRFLGMWSKLSDETNVSTYNAMYFHWTETRAKLHPQQMQRAFDWKIHGVWMVLLQENNVAKYGLVWSTIFVQEETRVYSYARRLFTNLCLYCSL